jgi:hypothetical protein
MGIDRSLAEMTAMFLGLAVEPAKLSLRDAERVLTRLALLPGGAKFSTYHLGWQVLIVTMVIWQVKAPALFHAAVKGKLLIRDVDEFFGLSIAMCDGGSDHYNHAAFLVHSSWLFILEGRTDDENSNEAVARTFERFGRRDPNIISNIEQQFFRFFEIND